jgi:hypothetical protein
VNNGHAVGEAPGESLQYLRRHGYLGNQHYAAFTLFDRLGECLKVDFGLAAAGNSVQQKDLRTVAGYCFFDLLDESSCWPVSFSGCDIPNYRKKPADV